jgi:hypothetical protein
MSGNVVFEWLPVDRRWPISAALMQKIPRIGGKCPSDELDAVPFMMGETATGSSACARHAS